MTDITQAQARIMRDALENIARLTEGVAKSEKLDAAETTLDAIYDFTIAALGRCSYCGGEISKGHCANCGR